MEYVILMKKLTPTLMRKNYSCAQVSQFSVSYIKCILLINHFSVLRSIYTRLKIGTVNGCKHSEFIN